MQYAYNKSSSLKTLCVREHAPSLWLHNDPDGFILPFPDTALILSSLTARIASLLGPSLDTADASGLPLQDTRLTHSCLH